MTNGYQIIKGVLLLVISTLAVAIGQTFWKYAQNGLSGTAYWIAIVIGLAIYGVGAIFMILGLKKGEFSKLHPILSFKYVWITIIGVIFFQETIGSIKLLGILCILAGVYALVK